MSYSQGYRRRGSMYVVILATSMTVSVIGLSAILATRIERRAARGTNDLMQARLYALSGIELGMFETYRIVNWRTVMPDGVWVADQVIGAGTFTLEAVDPIDGVLAGSQTDPVVLTATGVQGDARYKLQATLTAEVPPLNCLETAFHAGLGLVFSSLTLQSDQTVSTNGTATASNSTINADVEAVSSITGSQYNGATTTPVGPRTMPNAAVFNYYLTNGTPIDISLLAHLNHFDLQDVVLSPAINPYGAPNPEGIYILDCQGGELRIKNCRIVGTLLLLNPAPNSRVERAVNWQPAVTNYPALLVDGDLTFRFRDLPLDEAGRGVNFNPPGAPYEGVEDLSASGIYPSLIQGLVYVAGSADISNTVTFDGVVVVGNMVAGTGMLNVTYQPTFLHNPPPGFTDTPEMVVAPGSWRQVVD